MSDDVDRMLELTVATEEGDVHMVLALGHWHGSSSLDIEYSEANVQFLLLQPSFPDRVAPIPRIDKPNIKWHSSSNSVKCNYYCKMTKKLRTKSIKVQSGTPEAVQDRVDTASAMLQEFYDADHGEVE